MADASASFLPQPPAASPPPSHINRRPAARAIASPSKSRIPSSPQRPQRSETAAAAVAAQPSSSILASVHTTPNSCIKRRGIPSAASEAGRPHQNTHPNSPPSPEPAAAGPADGLSPATEWLGVPAPPAPEASPSPRCISQRHTGRGAACNRGMRSSTTGGRVAFGSSSIKASSMSPPAAQVQAGAKPEQEQPQQTGQTGQARPPSRGRETRGSMLRRSAVEEKMKGINNKQGGTFGSRPLNVSCSLNRSVSNARERPVSASTVTPPPAGTVRMCTCCPYLPRFIMQDV